MIKKINVGDFLSEQSHYEVVSITSSSANLHHMEADTDVTVSLAYIKELMNSANEFLEERAVTKADKRDGTPGIRTIFEIFLVLKYSLFALRNKIPLRPRQLSTKRRISGWRLL